MTLRLKGSYSVSAAENPSRLLPVKPITCNVIFLDDKSENFKLDKNARGQVLIDLVFDFLELLERDFFGLQFNDFSSNPGPLLRWLEPAKTLKKQLKGASTHTLWLRVKFYIPDPLWLQEEFTRYLIYLQVRKDVLNGILVAPTPILVKMAGLCLQSELGDYSSEECKQGYVNHIRLIPNQTPDFEAEASEAHKSFRSYVPAAAELEYLQIARRLEFYGIHPQDVTDRNRTKLNIGVSFQGLSVLREMKRIYLYTWDNIEKIAFSGKTFSVSLKHRPRPVSLLKSDPAFETSIITPANKKALNPTFHFDSAKRAKIFWQFAVTCHAFFRVKEPSSASSGGAFASNAVNGGLQAPPISATTSLPPSTSSPSGFSRFFFRGSRSRRSMSLGSGGGGLERTMSTLMELRRRSKSIERGFFRGVSRRFSRRRSFAHSGRTQSVNILNAYESRDSLGMQSIPSLLDESQTPKNTSTDIESPTTPDEITEAPLRKSMDEQNKSDHAFTSRKFRASAPALARKQEYLPSRALNLDLNSKPNNMDNLTTLPPNQKASPIIVSFNGKYTDSSILSGITNEPPPPERNRQDSNPIALSVINRDDGVLPRPTAFYNDRSNDHSDGEAKLSSRTRLSLASKASVEKALSINRSLESHESMSEMRQHSTKSISNRSSGGGFGINTDTSSVSPNHSDENLVTVRIRPNAEGHYGFNVSGGADHKKPVVVSRVGDRMPAATCCPRLNAGDQIIRINDRDISDYTQDQVVSSIRKSAESQNGTLELVVRSNIYLEENVMDDQSQDTGDAPPRPPKSSASANRNSSPLASWLQPAASRRSESSPSFNNRHHAQRPAPQSSTPIQNQYQVGSKNSPPKVTPKPRFGSSTTVRVKSTSGIGPRKALISDTEALFHSIREIEAGLVDGSLIRQFEKLERGNPNATMIDAKANENIPKNRYRDISPYDHSRVRIQGVDGDYINASFVKLKIPKSSLHKEYIASQGPLLSTCADFWQMCWEQESELIVMLTSIREQGREKCHKYWPDVNQTSEFSWTHAKYSKSSSSVKCIQLRVSNIKEEVTADIAYRELQLQRVVTTTKDMLNTSAPIRHRVTSFSNEKGPAILSGADVRRIVQLQYISWPDHGVPNNCNDLIAFVERMRNLQERGDSTCAVVHCSAGIGRTGVVILLDTAMDMIQAHIPVRPIEIVRQMREYREMLIQTPAQFQFVCRSIVQHYYDTMLKDHKTKKS